MLGSSGTYSTSIHTILRFELGCCLHACMHAFVSLPMSVMHSSVKSACKSSWSKHFWSQVAVSRAVLYAILMAGHTTAIGLSVHAAALPCSSQCTCSACLVLLRFQVHMEFEILTLATGLAGGKMPRGQGGN